MEQDIRFCELDGRRIAYATVGEGPLLVFGAKWVSHLEEEWDDPRARSFYEDLAQTHRVVRYDRLGAGLSDRELAGSASSTSTRACSSPSSRRAGGGPGDRVRVLVLGDRDREPRGRGARSASSKIVFFGSYVSRDDLPEVTRQIARRLRSRQLGARGADARRPHPPACERRRDRRTQPPQAPRRGRGHRGRVPRARAVRRRAAVPPAA